MTYSTNCIYCNKGIVVETKLKKKIYSCNSCISEDSAARNGIDEAYETEVKVEKNEVV